MGAIVGGQLEGERRLTQRASSTGTRQRLAALEARFAPGEVETIIDRSGVSGCGAGGRRAVTIRHRPTGREVTVAVHATQVENKLAALETLLEQLG
jgi:hypothetical protein